MIKQNNSPRLEQLIDELYTTLNEAEKQSGIVANNVGDIISDNGNINDLIRNPLKLASDLNELYEGIGDAIKSDFKKINELALSILNFEETKEEKKKRNFEEIQSLINMNASSFTEDELKEIQSIIQAFIQIKDKDSVKVNYQ